MTPEPPRTRARVPKKDAEPAPAEPAGPLPPPDDASLAAKIAWVQSRVGELPQKTAKIELKGGGKYEYAYVADGVLWQAYRRLLAPLCVAILPPVTISETWTGSTCRLEIAMTVVDGSTGEELALTGTGFGSDPGDKAYQKAQTTAVRLLLKNLFGQGGDADPEQHAADGYREPARQAPPRKQANSGIIATPEQMAMLHVVATEQGLNHEDLRLVARMHTVTDEKPLGVDSLTELPKAKVDAVLADVRAYRDNKETADGMLAGWRKRVEARAKAEAEPAPKPEPDPQAQLEAEEESLIGAEPEPEPADDEDVPF